MTTACIQGKGIAIVMAAGAAVLMAGCAAKAQRPTAQLTRANTLIEQAERAGAQRYASAELQQARDKVGLAEKAADNGKGDLAQRLATEAAADAELANARTSSGQAQRSAEELHRSTQSLQEEANRNLESGSSSNGARSNANGTGSNGNSTPDNGTPDNGAPDNTPLPGTPR